MCKKFGEIEKMKGRTRSKIIIEMEHLGHASTLFKFLQWLKRDGDEIGGDLNLRFKSEEVFIGHDVEIDKVVHIIDLGDEFKKDNEGE